MKKKAIFWTLAIFLLFALFSPGLIQAQGELTIVDSSAQVDFPNRLNFSLSARGPVEITDIRLHYRVSQMSFAPVTSEAYLEFTPATAVSVTWPLEMVRIGGLPSGSRLEYWWTVTDAIGSTVEISAASIQFDDNRYQWQSLAEGKVTLYWYEGDRAFAEELMAVTQGALTRLKESTGAELETPVKLYIYSSADDLRGAMIYPQEWTGGIAFTRYGILAIGISPDNLDWGRGAIAHELTHLVVHQVTLNPYGDIPTWLDEGLAMNSEGPLEPVFESYLNSARADNRFISVPSLASPFSAYAAEAALSYAESYSLVSFLISSYGQEKMFELLSTFREGATYDEALLKVYGFDMEGLDTLWREWFTESVPAASARELEPVLVGAGY